MIATVTKYPIASAVSLIAVTLLVTFIRKLYFYRTLLRGLPQPPGHHPIWGHLRTMGELFKGFPKRFAAQTFPFAMAQKYGLGDIYYLDLWPASPPMLIISDTDMFNQIAVKPSLPKHGATKDFLEPLAARDENLVTAEGNDWKTWRAAFNPGFSASHLITYVPQIVEECKVFCQILTSHAKNKNVFRMERASTRLTVDIIGRVVLDDCFHSQTSNHPLVTAFEKQVHLLDVGALLNPMEMIDFMRPIRRWQHRRDMDAYISKVLDQRFATRHEREKRKSVIDLALETYVKEQKNASVNQAKSLDPTFKRIAVNQIKMFVFAGHDTTSATICYAYHLLSKSPEALAKIRAEHDAIFGKSVDEAGEKICGSPHLLNQLPYTVAVIKETLRLYPPASTLRAGAAGHFIYDKDGKAYPTEHWMIWAVDVSYHRSTKLFGDDASVFRPERFLIDGAIPNKEGYIPFSRGPRNCIGQELAMMETKIILALTIRTFDFKAAYDELHLLKNDGSGYPSDNEGIQEVFGDEAYQIQLGTAKPREGWPCRVFLRSDQ